MRTPRPPMHDTGLRDVTLSPAVKSREGLVAVTVLHWTRRGLEDMACELGPGSATSPRAEGGFLRSPSSLEARHRRLEPRRRVARHSDAGSANATEAGRTGQGFAPAPASSAVAATASTTITASTQSSPTTKSYQNRANRLTNFMVPTLRWWASLRASDEPARRARATTQGRTRSARATPRRAPAR